MLPVAIAVACKGGASTTESASTRHSDATGVRATALWKTECADRTILPSKRLRARRTQFPVLPTTARLRNGASNAAISYGRKTICALFVVRVGLSMALWCFPGKLRLEFGGE